MANLEQMLNLKEEVGKLQTQKGILETNLDNLKKALKVEKDKVETEIAQQRQLANKEITKRNNELNKKEKEIEEKEKVLASLSAESKRISDEWVKINLAKDELAKVSKANEDLRIMYLDKAHHAELLVEQFNKKIEELGEKPVSPKAKKSKEK